MFPPNWFIAFDLVIQLVIAVIAMAVAIYAFRGYNWFRERTMLYLFLAFSLLTFAFFVQGLTLWYAFMAKITLTKVVSPLAVIDLGYWIYYVFQIIAYGLLVYAYGRRLRRFPEGGTLAGLAAGTAGWTVYAFGPLVGLIIVILLFIIVMVQLTHYLTTRSQNSLIVTSSFTFLLIGNIMIMLGNFFDLFYVMGKLLTAVAFLSLVLLLYRLRGPI